MLQKINEFQDQFDRKDLKIAELTDELSNLYLVIDFNKSKEPEFNEKSKFQSKRFFLKKGGKNDQMESKTYNCIDSESSDSSSKNKSINSKSKKGSLSPIRKKTVTLSSNLIEEEQKKNNSKDSRRKTSGSSIINFQASQLKSPLDQTRKKSNISLRIPASTPKRKSSITLKLTIPSKKISNNNIEITSNTLKSIDEFPREARKSVLKKGANAKSSANKVQSTLIRYIQQENASKKIEVKLSPKVDTFKKIEDKSSATIESSENSNDEKKIDKNKKKNQENPELYYPQNLILTNKYSKYRREKKLHSLYVKNSLTLQNVNNEHNGNNEIHFLKDENQFLFECIKRKNVIALFSNHIFPKNKIYKTKIELILEILMVHKKKSEYFDFLYSFLKNNNELPIQAQNKQIQTSNVFFLSKSTQTYPLPEKDANSKNSNELIEKINKKSHQFDILTTSIESRPDKHLKIPNVSLKPEKNNLISSENIANKESYYESKPKIKTQQHYNSKSLEQETNLDGSRNNSKTNIFQKNDNKPSQALNFYSIANKALTESDEFFKKTEFQNLSSINNEYFLNNRKNYNIIEEGESIGNSAPNLKTLEIKIEEKITKDVYEHIKLMNKNTDSNYSKLKFMFNYPFRSINAKFNEKEKNLESKQEENIQELTYDKFQMFFNNMLKIHKRCGTNCSHLKSFYKNIGFQIKIPYSRQEIILKKNIISQLPKIF